MRLLGSFGLLTLLGTATALYADDGVDSSGELSTTTSARSGDLQARASAMMQRANATYRQVMMFQSQARAQRDVIKLNCVNSKLIQLKAQLNIAESENVALQVAIADRHDTEASFLNLKSTADSVDRLHREAKLCVGASELGTRGSTSRHSPFIDEPTSIQMPYGNPIEAPAYASPFI